MTREEAIENLKMIHFSFINPSTEEQRHIITDTFEMAIEALKQETKTGRCIENLCDSCTNKACEFQSGILRSKCDFYIVPMPHLEPDNCGNYVVQQEPKTGHWIIGRIFPTKIANENLIEYRCSECDRAIRCTESQLVNYPYCHCGAKMESEG